MTSSNESAPTLQDVSKQYWPELDFQTLYYKLRVVARNTKDDLEGYMNQKLAGTDLVDIHDRIRRTASNLSLPNKRQINRAFDQGVDAVTEVAQLLKEDRSESELLEDFKHDKYIKVSARSGSFNVTAMQTALMHTFTQIQQAYKDVPLFHARPKWIEGREKKVWRLELDVGKVGVEVGPVTDRSLVELGLIDACFECLESCGCASITDIDRQVEGVDDEWQLLEA
ncbi:hypothetical protein E8E11_005230 [Didymella keratinophila]|nr:hypothetical protein E8E11_005230 [Didymella keratinophila]